MTTIRNFFLFLQSFFLLSFLAGAQPNEDYQKKYLYGKDLLKESRYEAAMQVFLPLTAESATNSFTKHASYLYAHAALKAGQTDQAKSMCLQLLQRYPDWDQKDDVYYLLSNVYFEQSKPRLALQFLDKINGMKKDVENMKVFYLNILNPLDTLKALQRDYPADVHIAKALAKRLSAGVADEKEKMLLNFLMQEFKLDEGTLKARRTSVMKSSYNIALLLPFQLNEIDPRTNKRSNQYLLEFYEGLRMAADSLKAKGISVNLYCYDTEKDLTILNSIISLPELKSMDMIIGPVFPAQIPAVTEFAKKNNIINISPFSANSKIIESNDFTYLFQPTLEVQAGNAARYASAFFRHDSTFVIDYVAPKPSPYRKEKEVAERKNVIIFYGGEIKDSLMALYYKDSCKAAGLEVIHNEKITRDRLTLLKTILSDTVKVQKCNHIFVSTSDEVVAANVISLMEISRQHVPLVTKSDWLVFNLLSFEQFEKRNVFFIHPDYHDPSDPYFKSFKNEYLKRTKIYPAIYSIHGYELMMYFGQALSKWGTYFKYGLDENGYKKGNILIGSDYSYSYTNKYVPITRFREKNLTLVNKK